VATKYFLRNVNVDTTCDGTNTPLDLNQTQGTSTTQATTAGQHSAWTEMASFDVDVSGDSPSTGSQTFDISVSINSIVGSDVEVRWRVQAIDDTGCSVTNSSTAYSSVYTTTGVKTDTLTLTWSAGDERLRLSVETRKINNHGNKDVTLDVNDTNSWVQANDWPASSPQSQAASLATLVPDAKTATAEPGLVSQAATLATLVPDAKSGTPEASIAQAASLASVVFDAPSGTAVVGGVSQAANLATLVPDAKSGTPVPLVTTRVATAASVSLDALSGSELLTDQSQAASASSVVFDAPKASALVPLKVATLDVGASTSLGAQDITLTGFGTVVAYSISVSGASSETVADHLRLSHGMCDGANEFCISGISDDGLSSSNVQSIAATDRVVSLYADADTTTPEAQAVHGQLLPNGIRIVWTEAPSSAYRLQVVLYGGDVQALVGNSTHSGAQNSDLEETIGFDPAVVFFAGTDGGTLDTDVATLRYAQGAASYQGSGQASNVLAEDDVVTATRTVGRSDQKGLEFLTIDGAGTAAIDTQIDGTTSTSTSFTVRKLLSGNTISYGWLALGATSRSVNVQRFNHVNATGNQEVTGANFWPQAVVGWGSGGTWTNAVGVAAGVGSHFAFDGSRASSVQGTTRDNQSTTDTKSRFDDDFAFYDSSALVKAATFSGFTFDGMRLNFTVSSTAKAITWVFFEGDGQSAVASPASVVLDAPSGTGSIVGSGDQSESAAAAALVPDAKSGTPVPGALARAASAAAVVFSAAVGTAVVGAVSIAAAAASFTGDAGTGGVSVGGVSRPAVAASLSPDAKSAGATVGAVSQAASASSIVLDSVVASGTGDIVQPASASSLIPDAKSGTAVPGAVSRSASSASVVLGAPIADWQGKLARAGTSSSLALASASGTATTGAVSQAATAASIVFDAKSGSGTGSTVQPATAASLVPDAGTADALRGGIARSAASGSTALDAASAGFTGKVSQAATAAELTPDAKSAGATVGAVTQDASAASIVLDSVTGSGTGETIQPAAAALLILDTASGGKILGSVSRGAALASTTLEAGTASPQAGLVSVSALAASSSFDAKTAVASLGAVSRSATPASVVLDAAVASSTGAAVVDAVAASTSLDAGSGAPAPGPVTQAASSASLAFDSLTATGSSVTARAATAASLALSSLTADATVGATSRAANASQIVFSAASATGVTGVVSQAASAASLVLDAATADASLFTDATAAALSLDAPSATGVVAGIVRAASAAVVVLDAAAASDLSVPPVRQTAWRAAPGPARSSNSEGPSNSWRVAPGPGTTSRNSSGFDDED
jgi:hypothetical protein